MSRVFIGAASFSSHFLKLVSLVFGAHIHVLLLAKYMNKFHISNTEYVHYIFLKKVQFI